MAIEAEREYSLGLYEKAIPNAVCFAEKLAVAAECGFDRLELSVDESDEKLARLDYTDRQRADMVGAARRAGVPILTMCLSGHRKYPLGSHDPNVRAKGLEMMRKALDLAGDLGIRLI